MLINLLHTCIVCRYMTLYQVSPVVWTNSITTRRDCVILVHTTGLIWYKVLYLHTKYVMGMYLKVHIINKSNNKITELRTILQRESQNS